MSRELHWTARAWDDYEYWQNTSRTTVKKINKLIKSTRRTPHEGIGKPEPLKGNLSDYWSRHIDEKNRLVYYADDIVLFIISCRFHYNDK